MTFPGSGATLGDVFLSNHLAQAAWGVGSGTSNVCGSYSAYDSEVSSMPNEPQRGRTLLLLGAAVAASGAFLVASALASQSSTGQPPLDVRPVTTDDAGRLAVGGPNGSIVGWVDDRWLEERRQILIDRAGGDTAGLDLRPALLSIVEDDGGRPIGYLAGDGFHRGGVAEDGWPTEETLERVYGEGSTITTTAVGDDDDQP